MGPVLVSLCKGMIIFANECVFYVKKNDVNVYANLFS